MPRDKLVLYTLRAGVDTLADRAPGATTLTKPLLGEYLRVRMKS